MKSEPGDYSIDDLERDGSTHWDGIRNYQARNSMMEMEVGDRVLFYHSAAKPPGVVGIAEVVKKAYPDFTAWDQGSRYFDPASTPETPRWHMVDIRFVSKFERMVSIDEVRRDTELAAMVLVNNPRLSVQPVKPAEYEHIVALAGRPGG